MRVAIMDFGVCKFGGIPTYAYHVKRSIEAQNKDNSVDVLSHVNKCYYNRRVRISPALIDIVNEYDCFIINGWQVNDKNTEKWCHYIDKMLTPEKRFLVLHDPAESLKILEKVEFNKVITISKRNQKTFSKATKARVEYTLHPYKRWSSSNRNLELADKKKVAISTSRVDFDKYYENILRAVDQGLLKNYEIHTDHVNRLYTYFTLDKKGITKVDWKTKYYIPQVVGGFEFSKKGYRSVYDRAEMLVDLSYIKGDGARSQYTFLEAFDFGIPIVLSDRWDPNDKYWKHRHNCIKVDPTSIDSIVSGVELLRKDKELKDFLVQNGEKRLKRHNYKKIGKKFLELLQA